jgi:hypothetical protein
MLAAARGETPDIIPYAPRIDLWYHSNRERDTLPEEYAASCADDIARAEGWALHKVVPEFMDYGEDAIIDRLLGIYRMPCQSFHSHIPDSVEREVKREGEQTHVKYHTPKGTVQGTIVYTEEMRRSGVSITWVSEHIIKEPVDYKPVGYIFENMKVVPEYEAFRKWSTPFGNDGLPSAYALVGGSPMHHILKILMDPTQFYYQHYDHKTQIENLADQIGVYYRKVFKVVADGPAEMVQVGGNYDDMITYPPFFQEHILPWLNEASKELHQKGKLLLSHTDGENEGLMDLLYESGIDAADAVCPHPMTKVNLTEYYRQWSDKITIFGGIPSNLLLEEATSSDSFERYMKELFSAVVPGSRFMLAIADTTPPDASFDRLRRIQELVMEKGKLPLKP